MSAGVSRYLVQQRPLRDPSGRALPGFFNEAADSSRAVIVAHDFFGLTPYIRSLTSRLSAEGFVAFAADFYRGKVAATREEAATLAGQIAWNQVAVELGLAVSALKQRRPGTRVAVLGFAMGGAAAMVAAAAVEPLDAAVTFYGIPQDVRVENTRLRVQGHFAAHDTKCTPARVETFVSELAARGVACETHRYDAHNGFFGPQRHESDPPEIAQLAWARTLQFLHASLG